MNADHERAVCDFAREIIAARTGEPIDRLGSPDDEQRDVPAIDELWASASHCYAVEHTRIEAFEGQIRNESNVARLLTPLRNAFKGVIPGDFRIEVLEKEMRQLPLASYDVARMAIARFILDAAPGLPVGGASRLASPTLPFSATLLRRDGPNSQLLIVSVVEADIDNARLERLRRSMTRKLPKLAQWARGGRRSVLVLESNDIQHSNVFAIFDAAKQVMSERDDAPDILVVVETDGSPWYGWVMKEGAHVGDAVPDVNGVRYYTEGQVARLRLHRR